MKRGFTTTIFWLVCVLGLSPQAVLAVSQSKIAVFHFNVMNLEASGYGEITRNILATLLEDRPPLSVLDRKQLDSFLSLNDLQQNDKLNNIVQIGNRLGLDVIIAGRVEKRGAVILLDCKVVKIIDKRVILRRKIKAFGDEALRNELEKLSRQLHKRISQEDDSKARASHDSKPKSALTFDIKAAKSQVALSWQESNGSKASGYKIYRASSRSGPYRRIAQVVEPHYIDTNLANDRTYFYKVKALYQGVGESDFSPVVSAKTVPAPESPILFGAESGLKSIDLIWSLNPYSIEDAESLVGYRVYRSKSARGPYKILAEIPIKRGSSSASGMKQGVEKIRYEDEKELTGGTTYYYQISVYDLKDLESDPSKPVAGTLLPVGYGLVTRGDMIREIHLEWRPSASERVQGYVICRSENEKGPFVELKRVYGRGSDSFEDRKDLTDDAIYYYRVALLGKNGRVSGRSETVSARTKGAPPPVAGLTAQSGSVKRVRLEWQASPHQEVRGYTIHRRGLKDEAPPQLIAKLNDPGTTSYEDRGSGSKPLTDDTVYHYSIFTFNKVNRASERAAEAVATTKPRPLKPAGLKATGLRPREVPLVWDANSEKDIVRYHVYRALAGQKSRKKAAEVENGTSYLDTGLKDGTEYQYDVVAEDGDGLKSDPSERVAVTTKPKPKQPKGLKGEYQDGKVVLSWHPNTEADIEAYQVFEKTFGGLKKITSASEPICRIDHLDPGRSKNYAVTALDKDGLESEPSQVVKVDVR